MPPTKEILAQRMAAWRAAQKNKLTPAQQAAALRTEVNDLKVRIRAGEVFLGRPSEAMHVARQELKEDADRQRERNAREAERDARHRGGEGSRGAARSVADLLGGKIRESRPAPRTFGDWRGGGWRGGGVLR